VPLLVKRLKSRDNFEGALYETFVIGALLRQAFKLILKKRMTAERATASLWQRILKPAESFQLKRRRSVQNPSVPEPRPSLLKYGTSSIKLSPRTHDRIIFIDLNRIQTFSAEGIPDWVLLVDAEFAEAERSLTIDNSPAPPAYVFGHQPRLSSQSRCAHVNECCLCRWL
jgi:hypothetical protein